MQAEDGYFTTLMRHPLASARCIMAFNQGDNRIMEVFELLSRYEACEPIGHGSYGFVCSARDRQLADSFLLHPPAEYTDSSLSAEEREELFDAHTLVAIKKLRQLFEHNRPRMWLCATREIQFMMSFRHDNVMSATDFFIPMGKCETMTYESIARLRTTFDSVYLVMKKMDYTLREVLDAVVMEGSRDTSNDEDTTGNTVSHPRLLRCPHTNFVLHPLQRDYRKFILYQIFRGVGYLHSCRVVHRDLKPENIMLDRSYNTCVTDFGQGRAVCGSVDNMQTVLDNSTQWYAAPETLTVVSSLSTGFIDSERFHGVDVWSIGCIAAEMLIGRPLFCTDVPGGQQQLATILRVLGNPKESAVASLVEYRDECNKDAFRAAIHGVIRRLSASTAMIDDLLHSPYHDEDDDELKLIRHCLAWDPNDRINIKAALESPYFVKDGYDPFIATEDGVHSIVTVRQNEISEAVAGRAFLWDLFVHQHPEVNELWKSLARKHDEEEKMKTKPALGEDTCRANR